MNVENFLWHPEYAIRFRSMDLAAAKTSGAMKIPSMLPEIFRVPCQKRDSHWRSEIQGKISR
jgi:hypothetical protein